MAKPKSMPKKSSLDSSLKELTALIEKMERDNISLEESLEQFEKGITLIRYAEEKLRQAEQKIQILLKTKNNDEKLTDYQDSSHE